MGVISHGVQDDGHDSPHPHIVAVTVVIGSEGADNFSIVGSLRPEYPAALFLDGGVGGETSHGLETFFEVKCFFLHLTEDDFGSGSSGAGGVVIVVGVDGGTDGGGGGHSAVELRVNVLMVELWRG